MEDWLLELVKGLGKFFLNPLLYWFFIITFFASTTRIKQERQSFGRKIYALYDETYGSRITSFLFGIGLSVFALVIGIGLHYLMIIGLILFTILFSITKRFTWLSGSYTFGFTTISLLFLPYYQGYLPELFQTEITTYQWVAFTTLMGVMLLFEAIMLLRVKHDQTFPEIEKGKRGKWIGRHRIKKIALIPFATLIPAGAITPLFDWWPIIEIGESSYGILFFPIIVGFEQVIRGVLPTKAAKAYSQSLFILAFLVIGIAISGYFYTITTLISVVVAIMGREWISYRLKNEDQQKRPFFYPDSKGLKILAILPGTPAEDIGLMIGETVIKVNGKNVNNQLEFYHALQSSSAFCKLDIIDQRGEIRFAQRALYQGEHHELGIIFSVDPTFTSEEVI